MCATSTSHRPAAHTGRPGAWLPPHSRSMIVPPTCRHHGQHVSGVYHTLGHLTMQTTAPNTPTQARNEVAGVAHSGRARGVRCIQETQGYSQRLGIQDNMCSELRRGWPTLQTSLRPPSPASNVQPHFCVAQTRRSGVVTVRSVHSGVCPDV